MELICTCCSLHKSCNHQVHGDGSSSCDVLIVGEAPGEEEDSRALPFVGKTGKFLRTLIDAANTHDLRVRYTNTVRCRPPNNRKPTKKELTACNFHLRAEIKRTKPKVVFLLGGTATQAVLGETSIKRIRGRKIIRDGQIYFATWHPSYVQNYSRGIGSAEKEFQEDILKALSPDITKNSDVEVEIVSVMDACKILSSTYEGTKIAFDIEATTIDPYLKQAKILCVSLSFLSFGKQKTYCIDLQGFSLKDKAQGFGVYGVIHLFQILSGFDLIAQNAKYDCGYVQVLTGVNLSDSLYADTMLMQYALDEREPKGLKQMVSKYLPQYSGYESAVQEYSANDEGFENVPIKTLMQYCGMDSFCTYKLHEMLLPLLSDREDYYFDILRDGTKMLCQMEQNGCAIDLEAVQRVEVKLHSDIELRKSQILSNPAVKKFGEIKSWRSPKFLEQVIFTNQKLTPTIFTPTGRTKLDIDTLEALHDPLADKFVDLSKLQKLESTYTGDVVRNDWIRPDGLLHSTFGFEADTGRLSSRGPNIQNIPNPKRSEYGKKYNIRSYFHSRFDGGRLISADYKAIELRVFAVLSNCKFFKEIFARNGDPHKEVAARINGCSLERVSDEQREDAKTANFGALYDESAKGLSERHGKTQTYWKDFLKDYHKAVPELKQYRKVVVHGLKMNGYVESPLGARRHFDYNSSLSYGLLSAMEREACNHPIQNAASNLTVLSAIKIEKLLRQHQSKLINLIHDCTLIDWSPSIHDLLLPRMIKRIMESIDLDWLTIPTPVDITITPNWGGE